MEAVHLVPDQCANFASHFSSVKIFQIDVFNFASHFIRVQIFQIYFSLKNLKFLFPPSHYNFCIVQCADCAHTCLIPRFIHNPSSLRRRQTWRRERCSGGKEAGDVGFKKVEWGNVGTMRVV